MQIEKLRFLNFVKILLLGLVSMGNVNVYAQKHPILWYDKPAQYWEEALPLGNGRLGAMVYGNPVHEEIQLNEETVYAGSPYNNYNPEAKNALSTIRQLIFDGKYPEAQALAETKILSKNGSAHYNSPDSLSGWKVNFLSCIDLSAKGRCKYFRKE